MRISRKLSRKPLLSPPSREAWIEIPLSYKPGKGGESPPSREAWIEIKKTTAIFENVGESPPSREAWIEMCR